MVVTQPVQTLNVLILIVMDMGLWLQNLKRSQLEQIVLILIVMDMGLWLATQIWS